MSRFSKSIQHLARAERTIPLGSQTFSKSRTQYPVGISPLYVTKAKGAEIWDLDGTKYIDLVSALASVTLGYGDKKVAYLRIPDMLINAILRKTNFITENQIIVQKFI